MKTLIYINDQFIDGQKATVSALDLSVLRGFGVMDYLRTYGGKPFRAKDHLERFIFSAEEIGLKVPKSLEEMEEIIEELIRRVSFPETSVKVVLTGGVSENQLMPEGPPVFFAIAYPFKPFPEIYFEKGIKITTDCYQRPFPKAKSTQYLPAIVALKEGEKKGAVDVLFYNEQGFLLETGTANFFALKEGKVITPKEGVLEGVTRKVVLEIEEVEERAIHKSEIPSFEGVFLTSSNKEIMPVIQIDNHVINNCVIPLRIQDLMKRFANHTKPAELFS
ncbi:MAG: aminotransferase class IV [Chlamydiales bacterium]|nr:aminotransferase class IV family protein [Chlamydiia bacterium]MCP5504922.1 aminotransferase class IV [Chlamydiales bacterium]